jgi:hypothetical protein
MSKVAPTAKDAWITAARSTFSLPRDKWFCSICDGYERLTQAHHVLPLSRQFDIGLVVPDHEIVWLCPNHHILVHSYLSTGVLDNDSLGCEKVWETQDRGWERKGIIRIAAMASERERFLLEAMAK